jgi:hypothetical protein
VPRNRNRQLVSSDAPAIVTHPYQSNAAALDIDLNAVRTGIQAVFDEFLDDRSRPLDHLACGDLVDELTGENADWHTEP